MSFDYEYSFGQKNNWRRWIWNRIKERCESPRDALILFLSGKDAIDVELASAKGFSAANMIAVERDQRGVHELRSLGLLTINGSLEEVITTWPRNKPVGVVLGDYCSDIPRSLIDAMGLPMMTNPSFRNTVFAFNFQRGRGTAGLKQMKQWRLDAERRIAPGTFNRRHRGVQLFVNLCLKDLLDDASTPDRVIDNALKWLVPDFFSYSSTNGNYFDSAVFISHGRVLPARWFEIADELRDGFGRGSEQRRKTAAVLAHHTMRHGGAT